MRKLAVVAAFLVLPVFMYTAVAAAYDVTVSSSTSSGTATSSPPICPAYSILQGTMCYCNAGYIASGGKCVKDSAMPSGTYEIYEDVLMSAILNDDKKCVDLGFTNPTDLDMCKRYQATPANQRDAWKSIQRPVYQTTMVTNPWAPASAQTLNIFSASSTQAIPANIPAPPPPPPPPPPPEPTSTPAVVPPPAPEPVPESGEDAPAQALAKLKPTKFDENVDALKTNQELKPLVEDTPLPVASTTEPTSTPLDALSQIAGAAQPVAINPETPGLAPLALTEADKIPESPNGVDGFEKPVQQDSQPGFFARVFNFLFGWL